LFRGILFPEPTCFDNKQNGFESGIDCGGTCSLMCKESVSPLTVVWAKAIRLGKDTVNYDLVALLSNSNIDNASHEVGYTFNLFDAKGAIFRSLTGSTTVPLDGKIPLIIQNVELSEVPVNVTVTLTDGPHYKVLESPTSPTVKVISRRYEAGAIPRIYATIANTKLLEIMNLPVRTLLFDKDDNVYAVGQTVIPYLPKEGTQEIIFTWDVPLPFPPTRIGIYPIFDPFEVLHNY
jgi:hypothetical protein